MSIEAQIQEVKEMLANQGKATPEQRVQAIVERIRSGAGGAQRGERGIQDVQEFVQAYSQWVGDRLPIDPVMLLAAWVRHEDILAEEAAGIEFMDEPTARKVVSGLGDGTYQLYVVGEEDAQGAADAMTLFARGVTNRFARVLLGGERE